MALARKRPGALTYASSGTFSAPHLAGELLRPSQKVSLVHVPFKGTGPAAVATLSGETTMMFGTGPSAVPRLQPGKLRALATTGLKRSLPDHPTISETVPGYEVTQWYGILVPAGTPREIADRLNQEIVRSVANPRVAQVLASIGTVPLTNSPKEFRDSRVRCRPQNRARSWRLTTGRIAKRLKVRSMRVSPQGSRWCMSLRTASRRSSMASNGTSTSAGCTTPRRPAEAACAARWTHAFGRRVPGLRRRRNQR
jgi:hypothetical protein